LDIPRPPSGLVVFTLWLLVFGASSQTMILAPILPLVGESLSIPEALLGTLVGAYATMVGAFAVISGPFSDRWGRRRILLLGTGLMTVALGLHALVGGYLSFVVVRLLAGIGGGVLSGSAVSYAGDFFPYERRGWATGWIMSGSAAGQIVGIPMGVVLAGEWGFRAPFLLFSAAMGATFLLVYLRLPQPDVQRSPHPVTLLGAARSYGGLLRRSELRAAAAAFGLMVLGVSLYIVYLPTWLAERTGASANQIATLFLVGGIANALVGPQAGRLSDRVGRKGLVLLSCTGLAVMMSITTLAVTRFWVAYPVFFAVMALVAMRIGPYSALLTALVPDHQRGTLLSMTVALGQIGYAVGGTASGLLYVSRGYTFTSFAAALSVLGMGLLVWLFVPEPRRATAQAAPIPANAGPDPAAPRSDRKSYSQ
jgi:predicted MFS family arabinose efflux permease